MSSRQPNNWDLGIWGMLRFCLSPYVIDEYNDGDPDHGFVDEFLLPWAHPAEESYLLPIRNLTLREHTFDSSSEGSNSMQPPPILPISAVSEQEGQEASENLIDLDFGLEATLPSPVVSEQEGHEDLIGPPLRLEATAVCPACGYGPVILESGSVSALDLSEFGVGAERDSLECDDSQSVPGAPVLSSVYPSGPSNDPGEDDAADGNDCEDDDLGLTSPRDQKGYSSGTESIERLICYSYNDNIDNDSDVKSFPLFELFYGDQDIDSKVDKEVDTEYPPLSLAYWTIQSAQSDPHIEEVSYNNTYPVHSSASSGEMELTAPHPESDQYDASGEDSDKDDDCNTDKTDKGLAISGQEPATNHLACKLLQGCPINPQPLMSPPPHESSQGGFHRASTPSTIDPPVVATGGDTLNVATVAGIQSLGATAVSNEPSPAIKCIFGAVKSACRLFTRDNSDSTCQSQQRGPAQDAVNVREKRIAPQFLARDLLVGVFRALPHDFWREESSGDHFSSDILDETFGEDHNERDDKDYDGDNDETEYKDQDRGWLIIGKKGKKDV